MLETLTALSQLPAREWDAWVPDDSPFMRHGFLSALEDSGCVGGDTGWQAAHAVLRDGAGQLCAAAPLYLKQHSWGEYVFDMDWARACAQASIAYYPKLLCAVPFSPVQGARLLGDESALKCLLDALIVHCHDQGFSGLHVNFTQATSDARLCEAAGLLERLGCQFHWQNKDYRDMQDFFDSLTSRKRKQFRKERQQCFDAGFEFEWRTAGQMAEADWDFVYQCYANTYHVRGRTPYLNRLFFSLLAERLGGSVEVVFASLKGRPVAMALSLYGGDKLFGRYWGCLAEYAYLHFETCLYQGIEHAINKGLKYFDAGAQGEHKLVRGFEPVLTRSWHYLQHPGLRHAVADFLHKESLAVQQYAQQAHNYLPYRFTREG